ncbi:ABC transporter ATP-binding protein [Haliangium ochraceum]|uniref:ABC transporter related protein n=1 Tax=Haliangium ochraceum (strain DSM 14365 / JCM 11303 / SMP-2) TaxID=502025 RepID=D0LG98_HALO1|nr:ABC transporter ATP-binding protein [Haliangium ochraceum]ACY18123.1 ABC transporter related protein [Haliangium ochraceum DSM 14365]
MSSPPRPPPLKRLIRYARGHRRRILAASSCSVLNKIFDLAPPVLIGAAVDVVVQRQQSMLADLGIVDLRMQLFALAIATVVVWGLESVFEYAYGVMWRNLAQTLQHELRLDGYSHVQSLDLNYFEGRATGQLLAVLNDDINQLERFLDGGANDLLQVATTVVVISAAFFALAPSVAWMAILPIPIILWGSFRFQRRIGPRYAQVREQVGQLSALLANNLSGIATIQSFVSEQRELERVRRVSDQYLDTNRAAIRLSASFSPLIRMAVVIGFTAMLAYGGMLAIDGALSVGAYSVLVFLTQRLLWPLTRLGSTFDLYHRAMASTERILDLLDTPSRILDGAEQLERDSVSGRVSFEGVTFAYEGREPALRELDLVMEAGKTTAIVGPTGAGKTSVIKLLLRFYDVGEGAVRVDGHDVRELSKTSLRRTIGLVSQDVFLLDGSVRDNIAYGAGERAVGDAEIEEAARIAEAHDFIAALPQGYDTHVGERGQKLSGGQRQRISIARAVLADPPILVLDEATSAVDNETEAAIQRSLRRIAVGRTTIVIAHRLSTVRHADRIYVLENGRLAESGRHDELLAENGVYASLWRIQTGEAQAA